ncbi:MAG: hypothetical protein LBO62_06495 [Endomicrobium sp.]|jgi:hypothetical protein|nr:hypothetical protein [Endomicrobium sp.]
MSKKIILCLFAFFASCGFAFAYNWNDFKPDWINDGEFTAGVSISSSIGGEGKLIIDKHTVRSSTGYAIMQKKLEITSSGVFNIAFDAYGPDIFITSWEIKNDGQLNLVGTSVFESSVSISGKGTLNIGKDIDIAYISSASINQNAVVNEGKFKIDAGLYNVFTTTNNGQITFTGGKVIGEIYGNGLINVNDSKYSKTIFANSVLGNDINLAFGTLKLGLYEVEKDSYTYGRIGNASQRKNFTMQDKTVFDMANGKAGDIIYIDTFTLNGSVKINADFDLAGQTSDKIDIAGSVIGAGNVDLSGLNIVSDFSSIGFSTNIALFSQAATADLAGVNTVYYKYHAVEGVLQVSGSYHITDAVNGLNFKLLKYESDPFQAAVEAYGKRMIRVESDYNISAGYNNIISTGVFTVIGGVDGVSINSSSENLKSIFILQNASTTLNAQDIVFKNGFNDSYGGAIYNEGKVFLSNVVFDANAVSITTDSDVRVYGGAVYNAAELKVENSQFRGNTVSAQITTGSLSAYSYGGAVFISSNSNIIFDAVIFENNAAQAKRSADESNVNLYAYGGAIYIDSDGVKTIDIENSVFRGNSAASDNYSGAGSREAKGGAIYNGFGNVLNIKNSVFTNNSVSDGTGLGGAIYNAGTLNLIAAGGNVEFTGNKSGQWTFNAIHNSSDTAVINLNASNGGKIIFNDAISGNNGVINVNSGLVEFNGGVSGNDIFLNAGTLKFGAGNSSGNKNNFTVSSGAVIDMRNGKGDTLHFNEFIVAEGTVVWKLDVNLETGEYDKITISSAALGNGKFDISQLQITNEFTKGYSLDAKILVNLSTNTPYNDYISDVNFILAKYHNDYLQDSIYRISHTADYGTLNFSLIKYSSDTFQAMIISTESARRIDMAGDYFAVGGFTSLLGDGKLIVNAGTYTINANEISNVFSLNSSSQTLELNGAIIINGKAELGGAIYNAGNAVIKGTVFDSNIAVAASTLTLSAVGGGAIYNNSEISVYDAVFKNNKAEGEGALGGAIYNDGGTVNLIAVNSKVEFTGNKANGVSNAFTAKNGAIYNLTAAAYDIIFNDNITSYGDNNSINVSASTQTGKIVINADMSGFGNLNSSSGNAVNLYGGSVKLGENAKFFTNVNFNMHSGATLDMSNSKMDNIALEGFSFNGGANLIIDADLRNAKTDSLLGSKLLADSSGNLVIKNIVILNDAPNISKTVAAPFADDASLFNAIALSDEARKAMGPVFIYDVSLSGGNLVFEYANDYNPSIFIAPVTMLTGGYLGQINSYRQAFEVVDDSYEKEGKSGLWVKPYAFSEDIELNGNLNVSNEAYGAYFGYDSKMNDIYSYTMNFSIYGSYNTLRQTYSGTEINQGGGMLGVSAVLYADNFFTALTANMGIISEHGQGTTSKDNFMMYTKGAALKSGYNIFFKDDVWQLQLSLSFSITSVDMAPYHNSAGVKVSCAKFQPFHIEPEVKLILNAFENFKLYADAAFVIGLSHSTEFTANDIVLPDFSIDPYLQYSLGGYKSISENFTAGGELFGRSGGRSGFGGQFTLKLKL